MIKDNTQLNKTVFTVYWYKPAISFHYRFTNSGRQGANKEKYIKTKTWLGHKNEPSFFRGYWEHQWKWGHWWLSRIETLQWSFERIGAGVKIIFKPPYLHIYILNYIKSRFKWINNISLLFISCVLLVSICINHVQRRDGYLNTFNIL